MPRARPCQGWSCAIAVEDGEIFCRGPLNFSGYFKDPDNTAESDGCRHGRVTTGDIGTIDDDGFLRIVDRKKEIIINSHGKNLSPAVIETAILEESLTYRAVRSHWGVTRQRHWGGNTYSTQRDADVYRAAT